MPRTRHTAAATLFASLAMATWASAEKPWEQAFGRGVKHQVQNPAGNAGAPPPPAPIPAPAPQSAAAQANAQALADAESLVATFNAAHEAGATAFSTMRSTPEVVAALARGVTGGGRYADTLFRVPGLDPARQTAALRYLAIERGSIVVRRPAPAIPAEPAPLPVAAPDPRTPFAGGKLLAMVPRGFTASEAANGDLVLSAGGAQLTLHLEASAGGLDAWGEVRAAGERSGLAVSMSGKKVYIIEPDRLAPKQAVVGFGNTLVSIKVESAPSGEGMKAVRLVLPGLIESLGLAVTK